MQGQVLRVGTEQFCWSVPYHFDADLDPDPNIYFDADPDTDPNWHQKFWFKTMRILPQVLHVGK